MFDEEQLPGEQVNGSRAIIDAVKESATVTVSMHTFEDQSGSSRELVGVG